MLHEPIESEFVGQHAPEPPLELSTYHIPSPVLALKLSLVNE